MRHPFERCNANMLLDLSAALSLMHPTLLEKIRLTTGCDCFTQTPGAGAETTTENRCSAMNTVHLDLPCSSAELTDG